MNAPRELADLLSRWQTLPMSETVYTLHGSSQKGQMTPEGWNAHARGAELWLQVDGILRAMADSGRNVEPYRRWQGSWMKGLFVPDQQWGAKSNGPVPLVENQGAIDVLYALADAVEGDLERYRPSEESKDRSIGALDELFELLTSDELPLGVFEKRYLFELISAIRTLLDEANVFGSALDLRRRIFELLGALSALGEDLETQDLSPLAKKLRGIRIRVVPWTMKGTAFALGALSVAADVKELGS